MHCEQQTPRTEAKTNNAQKKITVLLYMITGREKISNHLMLSARPITIMIIVSSCLSINKLNCHTQTHTHTHTRVK